MTFANLGLGPAILEAIATQGYKAPTTIQSMAIPRIMSGADLIAGAQTGTGKTASFVLPMLEKLQTQNKTPHPLPRALILTPTRELASQVFESVKSYGSNLNLRPVLLCGGVDYRPQIKKLSDGVDIVVATPGRLTDLFDNEHLDLSAVRYLVLDEADRMLDMGFAPAVRNIMRALPKNRQTVFFSATFNHEVKLLAKQHLNKPLMIQSEQENKPSKNITHVVHPVDEGKKRALTSFIIGSNNWQQVLIFTRTKASADRLSKELYLDGIKNMVIHGDRTQAHRSKALAQFKEGKIQALVATDVASRGLDIESLPHVINYELPAIPEDYVHRVGRTGRAGQRGHAGT